jgi:outer membrane biosynthesis protein TonB
MPRIASVPRIVSAGAVLLVLAACTPGGQFDPTTLLQNDMFDSKKKINGQREPVFPSGVPGTTTGVPPDLVKGYQPPPEQTDAASADSAGAQPPPEKPKPKPKPKVAVQTPAKPAQPPKRISIGPAAKPATDSQPQQTSAPSGQSQSVWPAPQSSAPAQQSQSVFPNPPATASH